MRKKKSLNVEVLARFRNDVLQLYNRFEQDLAALSLKYGFEINMWYSPSRIPQPNFKAGNILLDIDQIYDESEFKHIIGEQVPKVSTDNPKMLSLTTGLDDYYKMAANTGKNIRYRPRGIQTLLDGSSHMDFRREITDLRRKRKAQGDGQQF